MPSLAQNWHIEKLANTAAKHKNGNTEQNRFYSCESTEYKNVSQYLEQDEQRRLGKHCWISCQFLEPVKCNISFCLRDAMMWDFLSRCDKASVKCKSSHVGLNRGYSVEICHNIIDVFQPDLNEYVELYWSLFFHSMC